MFCGLMLGLKVQQRRLLSGHKPISFSRESSTLGGSAKGLVKSCAAGPAAASERSGSGGSGRRRRRLTDPRPDPHQPQSQQRNTGSSSSRDPFSSRVEQVLQQQGAGLGLKRASELAVGIAHSASSESARSTTTDTSSSASEASSSQASTPCPSTPSTPTTWSSGSSTASGCAEPLTPADHTPPASSTTSSSSSSNRGFISEEDDAVFAAINRISRFMEFRERCASEVLTKLAEVGYDPQFAQTVLQRMQEAGMQDDARFADMYARGQWLRKAQAPNRIAYELRMRRVSQQHIDAALAIVFGDSKQLAASGDPVDEGQEASWEQLVRVCRQRVEASAAYPTHKRRAKLATWLQRRGHSLVTAFRMFEELGI